MLALLFYASAVENLGARRTAQMVALVPCVTTLAAIPILGEPSGSALLGISFVPIGIALPAAIQGRKGSRVAKAREDG